MMEYVQSNRQAARARGFAEAKKHSDDAHSKCLAARQGLERHWEENERRDRDSEPQENGTAD
jgi:hypothetical protein